MTDAVSFKIDDPIIEVENLDFYYGSAKALHGINLNFPRRKVTALIGPAERRRNKCIIDGCHRTAATGWDGIPEIQSVPEVDL